MVEAASWFGLKCLCLICKKSCCSLKSVVSGQTNRLLVLLPTWPGFSRVKRLCWVGRTGGQRCVHTTSTTLTAGWMFCMSELLQCEGDFHKLGGGTMCGGCCPQPALNAGGGLLLEGRRRINGGGAERERSPSGFFPFSSTQPAA